MLRVSEQKLHRQNNKPVLRPPRVKKPLLDTLLMLITLLHSHGATRVRLAHQDNNRITRINFFSNYRTGHDLLRRNWRPAPSCPLRISSSDLQGHSLLPKPYSISQTANINTACYSILNCNLKGSKAIRCIFFCCVVVLQVLNLGIGDLALPCISTTHLPGQSEGISALETHRYTRKLPHQLPCSNQTQEVYESQSADTAVGLHLGLVILTQLLAPVCEWWGGGTRLMLSLPLEWASSVLVF